MPKLTSAEASKKWKDRLGGSVQEVIDGINRVTESPMAKSAAAEDKWFANIQRAHTSGKRKRALLGVSLEEWKDKAANIGAQRIPSGAAAAEGKMSKFYDKLFPFEAALQKKVNAMPSTTQQDSVSRATAWITGMAEFDKTK